jgi:hypothetical protein
MVLILRELPKGSTLRRAITTHVGGETDQHESLIASLVYGTGIRAVRMRAEYAGLHVPVAPTEQLSRAETAYRGNANASFAVSFANAQPEQMGWSLAQLPGEDDVQQSVGLMDFVTLPTCFELFRGTSVARDHASPSGMPPGMSWALSERARNCHEEYSLPCRCCCR